MKLMQAALAFLLMSGGAAFAADPAKVMDTKAGKVFTDMNGMTLYTFDKDEAGKTNCYDECARNWPPLMAESTAMAMGEWSIVHRKDGTKMWAYEGRPVYTYVGDKAPGEMTGDGKGDAWHAAKAD